MCRGCIEGVGRLSGGCRKGVYKMWEGYLEDIVSCMMGVGRVFGGCGWGCLEGIGRLSRECGEAV